MNFRKLISQRRSIYSLSSSPEISQNNISEICSLALKFCPTSFNSQSGRIIILLGAEHQKLWQETTNILQKIIPTDNFAQTQKKLSSFSAASGTILFFEDENTLLQLQKKYPLYADSFPIWAQQSQGMLQYIVWCLLAEHNIGASLQHYNPLINNFIQTSYNHPKSWRLCAQMPFGNISKPAEAKEFAALKSRLKIFGQK